MTEKARPEDEELIRLRHGDAAAQATLAALAEGQPEVAARLAEWDRQDAAIRTLYAPVAEEPVPERMRTRLREAARRRPPRPAFPFARLAAAVALLALGFAGGWAAARLGPGESALAQAAFRSHATYVVETAHPVEVSASDGAHLVKWLSKRLGQPLTPPDLGAQGFRMIGGRLLPGETGAAAMLMYEDDLGRRLSLYVTRAEGGGDDLRFAEAPGARAFWWIDGDLGCALVGDLPRDQLRSLAITAYHALTET